jgi:hypothetical protein
MISMSDQDAAWRLKRQSLSDVRPGVPTRVGEQHLIRDPDFEPRHREFVLGGRPRSCGDMLSQHAERFDPLHRRGHFLERNV